MKNLRLVVSAWSIDDRAYILTTEQEGDDDPIYYFYLDVFIPGEHPDYYKTEKPVVFESWEETVYRLPSIALAWAMRAAGLTGVEVMKVLVVGLMTQVALAEVDDYIKQVNLTSHRPPSDLSPTPSCLQ